jgi:ATP-dependent Clp protease ATP-binding subunit ClpC
MRRLIQRDIDNQLSRMLLDGSLRPGQQAVVDVQDGQLSFTVK